MKSVIIGTNSLKGVGLFAGKDFKNGETVLDLNGEITKEPTKYSIEVGDGEHITDEFGRCLNHSCEPNVGINREKRKVYAKQDISKGEEFLFDYNSNESRVASIFKCACGLKNCQGLIEGRNKQQTEEEIKNVSK